MYNLDYNNCDYKKENTHVVTMEEIVLEKERLCTTLQL